jgi:hypothetical protein
MRVTPPGLSTVLRVQSPRHQPGCYGTDQRGDDELPQLAMYGPLANSAGPMLRAGFTEVLVTAIAISSISVSASPIGIGLNPPAPACGYCR